MGENMSGWLVGRLDWIIKWEREWEWEWEVGGNIYSICMHLAEHVHVMLVDIPSIALSFDLVVREPISIYM